MTDLRDYCAKLSGLYAQQGHEINPYRLLAEQGIERRWSAHDADYGTLGECYRNAANLALWRGDLHYVEGVALSGGLPLPIGHAWVEDDDGNVIDNTWGPEDRDTERMAYLGVRVPDELLAATLSRREVYGVLDDRQTVEALLGAGEERAA